MEFFYNFGSDQSLRCLPFHLHLLLQLKAKLSIFRMAMVIFIGVPISRIPVLRLMLGSHLRPD